MAANWAYIMRARLQQVAVSQLHQWTFLSTLNQVKLWWGMEGVRAGGSMRSWGMTYVGGTSNMSTFSPQIKEIYWLGGGLPRDKEKYFSLPFWRSLLTLQDAMQAFLVQPPWQGRGKDIGMSCKKLVWYFIVNHRPALMQFIHWEDGTNRVRITCGTKSYPFFCLCLFTSASTGPAPQGKLRSLESRPGDSLVSYMQSRLCEKFIRCTC